MRFPAPGAAGAVWEDFLETSLVCLRGRPVDAPRLNLQSHSQSLLFFALCGLVHYVAQVTSSAAGTKITNTGTNSVDGPVTIVARALRPSASEGLDVSLARRSVRLRPISR